MRLTGSLLYDAPTRASDDVKNQVRGWDQSPPNLRSTNFLDLRIVRTSGRKSGPAAGNDMDHGRDVKPHSRQGEG